MPSVYIYENGPANAPTIVLLHGGGMGGWSWRPQIDRLADYHLLVPDLPGQGRSIDEGPFAFADAAAKVAEVVRERCHGGGAHIAGLSLGAQVAIHLLAAAPQAAASVFATGTLARPLPGSSLVRPLLALYSPFKNLSLMIRANMWGLGVPREYYDAFAADTRAATTASLTEIFRANMAFATPAGLGRVTAPVLLTVGEKEYGLMKRSAQQLEAAIPGARAYTVSGVGHNWPLTHPDLYTRTLRAWLSNARLPAELKTL